MNTDLASAVALAKDIVEMTKNTDPSKVEIGVCPPYPFLTEVMKVFCNAAVVFLSCTMTIFPVEKHCKLCYFVANNPVVDLHR